jgi:hypothetical protein
VPKDPNEIGTLWFNEWNGKQFWKGPAFHVPSEGITVDLVPFSFQRKDGSGEARGLRVIRVGEQREEKPFDAQEQLRKAKASFCGEEPSF